MSTIRATYVQHGSSAVPNITLNASGQVIVASGIVSSGTFAAPTGSAAAPGVYFVGDTNTGLYSPGADQVAVATNGTGRLFVDASGNVGVGGSAPNYSDHKTLSLFGAANNGAGFIQFTDTSNNADAAIFADDGSLFINADYDNTSSDSSIRFRVDGSSEKVRITSAGRVGIGTSQPVGQTYIAGPNTSNFGVAADAALNIAAASGALANRIINLNFAVVPSATNAVAAIGMAYGSQSGFGNGHLIFGTRSVTTDTAPTERMRIDSSGRVGIGTTSPTELLHVNAASGNCIAQITGGDTGTARLRFGGQTDNSRGEIEYDVANDFMAFKTNNLAERARIDSSGRLLVGTSSARSNFFNTTASAALQIEGQGGAGDSRRVAIISNDNTAVAGGNLVLAHQRSGSVGGNTIVNINDIVGRLSYQGNDGAQFVEAASINCEVDGTPGANDMPGRLVFYTTADGASSPTERMRIKEDGVVAIGASDSPNGDILFASCATSRAAGFRVGPTAGTFAAVTFYDGINTDCGSIDINTTANTTAYTTSSDYRLKSNVQPLTGNLQRLAQLKPCKWEWLSAPEVSGEGFLAHEAQEVVPEAVTGTKDEVDENGNPVYQGIDQSKLVPLLTAALQEAIGEIESLKARLTAAGI
jgi:hypothetical protein